MIVTMTDIRQAGMCSHGVRGFCKHHDIDYMDFLKNGIDAEKLKLTEDGMAMALIKKLKAEAEVA